VKSGLARAMGFGVTGGWGAVAVSGEVLVVSVLIYSSIQVYAATITQTPTYYKLQFDDNSGCCDESLTFQRIGRE
jgi:hypothetical protein